MSAGCCNCPKQTLHKDMRDRIAAIGATSAVSVHEYRGAGANAEWKHAYPGWHRRRAPQGCCQPWGLCQVQQQAHPAVAAGQPETELRAGVAQENHSQLTPLHLSHQSLQEMLES